MQQNPWAREIPLEVYNEHMRDPRVGQLKALNKIMEEQMAMHKPRSVAVLGSAGGNGFEHLKSADKIYAIDINEDYLRTVGEKYAHYGNKLELIHADLKEAALPKCDLLICNLIIEYVGIDDFAELLERSDFGVASCAIQKNCGESFITQTRVAKKLECLNDFHHNIDGNELDKRIGLKVVYRHNYVLPNNKEFVRLDFKGRN